MEILALVIPLSILALLLSSWAHLANYRRPLAIALFVVFGAFSVLMIVLGGAAALMAEQIQRELDEDLLGVRDGLFMIGMGAAVGLPLLPPVRALVARVLPIDARSMSDMMGLSVMSAVAVMMIWTIEAADTDTDIGAVGAADLVLQALLLVIIAYFAIGGAITRDLSNVRERLGLYMPTGRQVALSVLLIIPIFIVSALGGALTEWLQPGFLDEIEDVMGEVTQDVANLEGAIILGLSAGIGEEILFRGAIQPRYGIIFSSIIFTLIHVQYGFSFVLAGVFLTSIILGIQRMRMNTTCCIITHATYNFAVVMISLAA